MLKDTFLTLTKNSFSPLAFKDIERKYHITEDEVSLLYMIYINIAKMSKDKVIYKKALDVVNAMEKQEKSITQTYLEIVDLFGKFDVRRNYVEKA